MKRAPVGVSHGSVYLLFASLTNLLIVITLCGCGGGTSSPPPPPSPPPPAFQPRPFPGDFFMRLPSAAGDRTIPAAVYDQALKEIFVSDPNFNSVEVYSTVDGHKVGEVSIPGPAGLGFTPDFSKLYVGTITPNVYIVDPVGLHVTGRIAFPASMLTFSPGATGATLMPVMPYPMADGSVMLGMGYTSESSSAAVLVGVEGLVRYDAVSGAFTPANPGPSNLGADPARSLDGKYLFVYGFGSAGYELLLYSSVTQGYLPVSARAPNGAAFLAANADGSKFAVVDSGWNVTFFNVNLQMQTQYSSPRALKSAIQSRDGKFLYLTNDLSHVVVLDTQTGTPVEYFSVALGSNPFPTPLVDVDETYHVFGLTPGGLYVVDASHGQATPPAVVPLFSGIPSTQANPNVGPLAGGTRVQFIPAPLGAGSADGIANSMEAYFGTVPATNDVVGPYPSSSNGENFLTATTPPAKNPGPVSVALTDANNNTVLLPDAFTYGPHILRVQPNTALVGDQVTIYAYGLGFFDVPDIHVTIGGAQVDMTTATLNSYASNDYPEQAVTVPVPPGTPGWADVVLTTSNGTDTLKRGMQYLKKKAQVTGGQYEFAAYDTVRDVFYLTGGGNSVAVFNPNTQVFGQALQSNSISSGAVLQELVLTPDNSKLLVVDPKDQSVIVFDIAAGTSTAVNVRLASDPTGTQVQPITVVAAANNRAFVSVTPCVTSPVRQIDLTSLQVSGRPDAGSSCGTYVTYPEYGRASADGSKILYAGSSGQEFGLQPSGPEYIWSYNTASDTFAGPVIVADTPWGSGLAAVDGDGGITALAQGTLDQRLLPSVPIVQPGFDARLNDTGSLLYSTGTDGSHIAVSDTRNGRLQLQLAVQNTSSGGGPSIPIIGVPQPLAIDPSGSKILGALQNGVVYFQLAAVPLAVGTVTPAIVSAGGVTQVRGSGFVAGLTATNGGKAAACSVVDSETLSCTVPNLVAGATAISLTNPDGHTYSFENALVVQ
jgi:hypothetical protein